MGSTLSTINSNALGLLLEKVYRDRGHDFRGYKSGTVVRRLERRLQVTGIENYLDYMQFLDAHPEEYERLISSLTIAVSGFFRSKYSFQQLARLVLPELLSHQMNQDRRRLRFWSTACARGEEPYSIAILLAEFLGDRLGDLDIQIYATDINQQLLKEAEAGVYSFGEPENLPEGTLEKYFIRSDQSYLVSASIREMVHFSYFDLTSTTKPPFRELDCIFCCNILIYLQRQLQERLLGILYEALATPGYLVLGEVETPTDNLRERLKCLDGKARIYKKIIGGNDA